MEQVRPVLTLLFTAFLFLGGMLPLFRHMSARRSEKMERFVEKAKAEGRVVTGYLQSSRKRRRVQDVPVPGRKKTVVSARYFYYAPDGKKYETKCFTGHALPDQIELFLFPDNPAKYLTRREIQRNGCIPLLAIVGYAVLLAFAAGFYCFLGLFLP